MKSAGFSVGTVLPLHRNFELQGAAGMVQLLDDAAASPWVVKRGELTDIWGNAGVAFRF
jgi:outer membrane scaffolding protein for murein synthesis (MipA/OmpV family)